MKYQTIYLLKVSPIAATPQQVVATNLDGQVHGSLREEAQRHVLTEAEKVGAQKAPQELHHYHGAQEWSRPR